MLSKTTHVYAHHELDIPCDVYEAEDYPSSTPVFLFFHSGGLVGSYRDYIPPWLVQVCLERKWPLISASYRFLPQAGSKGLLQDAVAAFQFARNWKSPDRKVIAGGASAGFFLACLLGHHATPKPIALLSITGIPTFRHAFFSSSTLLTPAPLTEKEMGKWLTGPTVIGTSEPTRGNTFALEKLTAEGKKNPDFVKPTNPGDAAKEDEPEEEWPRGCLYDYYLYWNKFAEILCDVDPGFGTPQSPPPAEFRKTWPTTVIMQGDNDYDLSMDVSAHMAESMGKEKVKLFLASGQEHLFEATKFVDDEGAEMDTVREAIQCLDGIVGSSKMQ